LFGQALFLISLHVSRQQQQLSHPVSIRHWVAKESPVEIVKLHVNVNPQEAHLQTLVLSRVKVTHPHLTSPRPMTCMVEVPCWRS
jgi:hypothetical protein